VSARVAVTGVFFINGAVFSSWYARLPDIQAELGISTGALGIALLGAPAGLLAAQPLAGALVARVGSRPVVGAAPLLVAPVVLPALAVNAPTLLLATLIVGAANGVLDISMNVQGLAVERAGERRIFNSLHAAFSFGALAGAVAAAAAIAAGLSPPVHLTIVAVVGAAAALACVRGLLPVEADAHSHGPRFARPSRRLVAVGAIAFCALLAEGSVFDWSAIFMRSEAHAPDALAPIAFAAFSLTMATGRLLADRAAERFGPHPGPRHRGRGVRGHGAGPGGRLPVEPAGGGRGSGAGRTGAGGGFDGRLHGLFDWPPRDRPARGGDRPGRSARLRVRASDRPGRARGPPQRT
jgi:MFS family permease